MVIKYNDTCDFCRSRSTFRHLDLPSFVNIVLIDCNDVKADENVNIFKAFQHYFIIESGRFK